ncbi:GTP-binding protein [Rhodoferax aquaticus]|uniref:GTP-binding protein n=1 Tax=Rhodoferax aquaticus TaxID=2527691 RepID=A0A515ESA1_9BURK|nr:GTP-binding protein [Rhodoferax aquaticus]QDL55535.1 GTP-binding protein [Rhodoferax aquaticus]QDL55771.1 GTP-binding protein [Rhodoferax aquaticus]
MNEYKILISGTTGSGKTTAIGVVSDSLPIVTDVKNTDPTVSKLLTTVGLDFGLVELESGNRLRLFGTPGQDRFDFLWKILAKNALGLIILIDNSRPKPLEDLEKYLNGFSEFLGNTPCVIGVGRLPECPDPDVDAYADFLFNRQCLVPVVPVDVRQRDDVLMLIDILLTQIEADL